MIEVKTSPGAYSSVHGDLIYVAYEGTKANDPVTYPDYRYIADVYATGVLVARLKAYPDPVTKMGVFNIGNIMRNYITPVFNPTNGEILTQVLNSGDFNVSGTVIFGEEYGFDQYPALINGVGSRMYGHYNGRLLGTSTNLAAKSGKIASDRPNRTSIYRSSKHCFVPYLRDDQTPDFTIIGQPSGFGVGADFPGTFINSMMVFDVSPVALNAAYGEYIQLTDTSFTVQFGNNNRLLTFDLKCEPKFTVYTLHFLNRYGGFESRDFTKLSRKLLNIEKKDFGRLPYTVNASGVVSYHNANNVYNETRSVYASQYTERMTLNTDILTDEEYQWLADLILSPMVYMEMDTYYIPVVIEQSNYEFRKIINDKLTNLTVEIAFGDQFNAQYR